MTNEKDPKLSAKVCFDSIGLDPDLYRIGHTKASSEPQSSFWIFGPCLDSLTPTQVTISLTLVFEPISDPLGVSPALNFKIFQLHFIFMTTQKPWLDLIHDFHERIFTVLSPWVFWIRTLESYIWIYDWIHNNLEFTRPHVLKLHQLPVLPPFLIVHVMPPVIWSWLQDQCKTKRTPRRLPVSAWIPLPWMPIFIVWVTPRQDDIFILLWDFFIREFTRRNSGRFVGSRWFWALYPWKTFWSSKDSKHDFCTHSVSFINKRNCDTSKKCKAKLLESKSNL